MTKFAARNAIAAAMLWGASALPSLAQTAPNWTYDQVPTPAQWNAVFAGKQDYLGAAPVLTTGGIMTGRLVTAASSSLLAGLNLTPGSAPSAPSNGDMWVTTLGLYVQVNGTTVGPMSGPSGGYFAASSPLSVTFPSGVTTYACPTCGVTGSPLSQFAATTSAQLAGIITNETGTGSLVFATSPVLVTPSLGVAAGTSLALGGATIGSDALGITGTATISGTLNLSNASINSPTGALQVLNGANGQALRAASLCAASSFSLCSSTPTNGIFTSGGVLFAGATSGTTQVNAAATASGVLTLPAVTDTLVAQGASQPLSNKNLTASSNVLGGVTMTLGSDATGDVYYRSAGGFLTRLPIGTNGYALTVNSGLPSWQPASSAGSITDGSTAINSGVSGSFLINTGGTLSHLSPAPITNSIGANVLLNVTSGYFDGPTVAQGTTGTWWVSGTVTVSSTLSEPIYCKLWDGTTVIAASSLTTNAGGSNSLSLSGYMTSPAGNLRISCRDPGSTNGLILANNTNNGFKDTTISAHRIQ